MQVVKKIFFSLVVLWIAILFFMPKQMLYYKLEEVLAKNDIKINEKRVEEGLFSFKVYDSKIFVKGIELASVKEINFFTLLFYTKINIKDLELDSSLQNMAPTQIDTSSVTHALWNPVNININAEGPFGGVVGTAALMNRTLRLDFNETNQIQMLKANLKQDEKGWFYETTF